MKKVCAVAALLCFTFFTYAQRARHLESLTIDPSQINIVRDGYGVPHIFAKTDAEVAYGLAWAHAEDDFETLQKCFLASKSMLGQLTGRDGAKVDYVVHLLRLREVVDQNYNIISDDFKEVLNGYSEGLNAYAFAHPKSVLIKRGFPISGKDILVYSLLQLAVSCGVEDALKKIYNGSAELAKFEVEGSNAFAFNSNITEDGSVFLAINTHHPLEGQVAWYEAHLVSDEGWNMLGALFPGSPVIFTGVNENLGWTHTVNHPDKLDMYQLDINPENVLQYKVDGQWYDLEETVVKLKVKVPGLNLLVKKKAYWSIFGPTVVTEQGVFSLRTPAIMDIRAMEQWYRMNKAKSFQEFKSALRMEAIPAYNIVYADKYDTIYYVSNAKLPKRSPAFNWRKTVPGNTSATLWKEFYSLEDLPQVLNPRSGYVYNTNHSVFRATAPEENPDEKDFDSTMGYETHENNRSLRVRELLKGNEIISYEEFKQIKYDLQLPAQLAYPVNIDSIFLLDEKRHPEIADVIHTLKRWDRKGSIDSEGATIFSIFFYRAAERYSKDSSFNVLTADMAVQELRFVKDYLLTHFGKTKVALGEYQRHERGNKSLPLPGLPDVLAAMYSSPTDAGRVKGTVGECYVGLIRFTPDGPEIETVNAFGASNRPGNRHYDDQMNLFLQHKTKKMTLDPNEIYRQAETVYHPEIFSTLPLSARLNRNKR